VVEGRRFFSDPPREVAVHVVSLEHDTLPEATRVFRRTAEGNVVFLHRSFSTVPHLHLHQVTLQGTK
jgi:hypothetical protein